VEVHVRALLCSPAVHPPAPSMITSTLKNHPPTHMKKDSILHIYLLSILTKKIPGDMWQKFTSLFLVISLYTVQPCTNLYYSIYSKRSYTLMTKQNFTCLFHAIFLHVLQIRNGSLLLINNKRMTQLTSDILL
jgi:hypothetical protein